MSEFMTFLMSYETLRAVWWLFLGVLLIGFAVTGGFDLGVGMLLKVIGRSDEERRVLINTVGPTWDGNQVWLILGGGAIFAAYPLVYAASFSGFYFALIVVLFALILRPVGFEYRSKIADPRWRGAWDWGLTIAGFVPALVIGVAFGNLLQGVPFRYDPDMRVFYEGNFFQLLNPIGLLVGVVCVAMLVMQGATFLLLKTEDVLRERARKAAIVSAMVMAAGFVACGFLVAGVIGGYKITSPILTEAASNPTTKTVVREVGAWLANFNANPILWLVPLFGVVGAAAAAWLSAARRGGLAFICSSVAVAMVILTVGTAMFPFLMPSSLNPNHSLTAWDSTSSLHTLRWMFWMVILFLPIVLLYTTWVYRVMRGTVTVEQIRAARGHFY